MPDRTPERPGFLSRLAAKAMLALERKAAPALGYRHSAYGGGAGGGHWWGDGRGFLVGLPDGGRDVAADAGDLWLNSAVSACLSWLMDQCAEPFLEVLTLDRATGDYVAHPKHELIDLLEEPNGSYDYDALFAATVLSWQLSGDAYWIKARAKSGKVLQLWHAAHWEVEPVWPDDGSAFISGYRQTIDGVAYDLAPEDVVHFRRGMDPANPRRGLSPLAAVLREVATDNSAAAYESDILRNMGIVPTHIQPAEVGDEFADPEYVKERFQSATTGPDRGRVWVSSARVDIQQFGLGPKDMSLGSIRYIPEDRICAATGVNAMVVGLSSGSVHKTYNNLGEATRAAYNRGLIPMQRGFARALTRQLLHADFGGRPGVDYCEWNYGEVAALQEDATARIERAVTAWNAFLIKRGEACEIGGLKPPAPEDDVFKESIAVTQAVINADADDDGRINDSIYAGADDAAAATADGEDTPVPRLRIAKSLANGEAGKVGASTNGDGHEDHGRWLLERLRGHAVAADGLTPSESRRLRATLDEQGYAIADIRKMPASRIASLLGDAPPEREDDADPFPRIAGQVAALAGLKAAPEAPDPGPTGWEEDDEEPAPDEANTYGLPTGRPIAEELREFLDRQMEEMLGTVRTIGADLGDPATWTALPPIPADLTHHDRPMAEAMTPIIGAYWDESGKRVMARLGLDPDDWRVVDPNTRRMIEAAAFAFSKSTNATTTKDLRTALDTLRRELAEGIVDRGEALPTLTKRVQSVFETASKDRAKVIAETEASRAVHQAQLESARQSTAVWGKKLLLSSDACQICLDVLASMPEHGWPLDDAMHDDGKGHPEYSVATMPPIHPRCRCSTTLVIWEDAPAGVVRPDDGPIFPADDDPEETPPAAHDYAAARFDVGGGRNTVERMLADGASLLDRPTTLAEMASVAGVPADATRIIFYPHGRGSVVVEAEAPGVAEMRRTLVRPGDGGRGVEIHNDILVLDESHRGRGRGAEILMAQVRAAHAAGFETITTEALRDDRDGFFGYHVWPKLGYDADIPAAVLALLPAEFSGLRRVSDLMKTEGGRAAWKQHGDTTDMTFDLGPGSLGRRILESYVKGRAARDAAPSRSLPPSPPTTTPS